jgi:hypothetical protein
MGDGTLRYTVCIPNVRRVHHRWLWQARLYRYRYMRGIGALTVVASGLADPEPDHGGFI